MAVRIRPLSEKEKINGHEECIEVVDETTTRIRKKASPNAVLRSQQEQTSDYQFDQLFGPESTQQEVYDRAVAPDIPNVLQG